MSRLALGLAMVGLLAVRVQTADEDAASGKTAETASAASSGWAGHQVCAACHPERQASIEASPHAVLADAARPVRVRGCEACHGPGQAHVNAGGGKGVGGLATFARAEPTARRSASCLVCHAGAEGLHDWKGSTHALAGVACPDCHRIHTGTGDTLLAKPPPELCYGCHLEVRAKFALTEHHKVDEGVMSCLDCHRPHGSRTPRLLRGANDRACLRCHGELEGPWVFEHFALVSEGCQRCHDPHGSVNRHLLVRQQVAQLCYECHTVTPTSHVQPSFRDCTRCHVAIHGSNVDPRFLER